MALKRRRFQGVGNILRFNWPFYAFAGALLITLFITSYWLPADLKLWSHIGIGIAVLGMILSTLVSWWVYDASELYHLSWLPAAGEVKSILNIAAGFDEVSPVLEAKYPAAKLTIADFYNPQKHTEPSIRRARKRYSAHKNTITVSTQKLPFAADSFDVIVALLAVHEIRDGEERTQFMQELGRVLSPEGRIYLTEHLRDAPNFGAYNFGAFHFHSRRAWFKNIAGANLKIVAAQKTTPFITTFTIIKNGVPN